MKRRLFSFQLGLVAATLSVLFQVAGFSLHLVLHDHGPGGCGGGSCPSESAAPQHAHADSGHGGCSGHVSAPTPLPVSTSGVLLAEAKAAADPCGICEAFRLLRPIESSLELPVALAGGDLSGDVCGRPQLAAPIVAEQPACARGPPSLLV